MKIIVFGLFGLLSTGIFAQEIEEEFLPIEVEGKEAFMSTKTGEYTFLEHATTDPEQLETTASGVVYTDISSYTIKKGETLSAIAKKNDVTVGDIKKHNKVTSSNLKIGSELKIVKKHLIKSSSPVISYAGEKQIIARLRPGETPGQFAAPPSVEQIENEVIETKKTEEKPRAKVLKAEENVKNPIFGLDNTNDTEEEENIKDLSEAISEEVNEVKTEIKEEAIVANTPKQETKKEKLARLKVEMEALEAELEEQPIEVEEETVVVEEMEVATQEEPAVVIVENMPRKLDAKTIKEIKETNAEAKIEESESGKKVMVFENKPKNEVSTAEKAQRAIAAVRETEKKIEASKNTEILEEENIEVDKDSEENDADTGYYTVEKGNSLWSIAKEHNMTVDALKKLNNLKNNNLSVGQKLKVSPKNNPN
ncbi:LysM peptidoglycan-binding domain-containing protein [Lacinutrix chionoecetis]